MKRSETKVYVNWVIEEFKKNPDAYKDYTEGKGIIATRENFLAEMQSDLGERGLAAAEKGDEVPPTPDVPEFGKTIIVPVAIPGCGKDFVFCARCPVESCVGKTSVAVALSHIFGFGHTQSDDVHAKKAALSS
jgi:tRNA ligase